LNIDELEIVRLLNGEASEELKSKINNWINASETNKAEFKLYKAIWRATYLIPNLNEFNLEDEWLAFEEKIDTRIKTFENSTAQVISMKNNSISKSFRNQG
jgi:hypothetical protein